MVRQEGAASRASRARPGLDRRCRPCGSGHIYEIKSTYILQPGPAALTEGVRQIHYLLCYAMGVDPGAALMPEERIDPDAVD